MEYQMEKGKNRLRPLTPTSHFLVSIEYQYCSNPKEDGSQTSAIKSFKDINAVANTARGVRDVCVCVCEQIYEWGREI